MGLQAHDFSAYSFLRAIKDNEASTRKASLHYCSKAVIKGKHYMSNVVFTNILILLLITAISGTWTYSLLLCCCVIHPHPPVSSTSTLSIDSSMSNSSCSMTDNLNRSHHLSFVHYNVQSISSKLNIIYSELLDFDILAFSETWLSPDIPTHDLLLDSFNNRSGKTAQLIAMVVSWIMSKRDYTTSADKIMNLAEQNVFGLNVLTRLSMFYLGYFTDLQILTTYFSSIEDSFH